MDAELTFGDLLAQVMRRRYIAAIDLSRALGVSPALVGRWLRSEALPRPEDVEVLSKLLGGLDGPRLLQAACSSRANLAGASHCVELQALSAAERDLLKGLPTPFQNAFASALEHLHGDGLETEG